MFLGCKHAIRGMRQSSAKGSIINISSVAGLVGVESLPAYCSSKAGVRLLTKSVALHCARKGYGIRVNAILPGPVASEMLMSNRREGQSEEDFLAGFAARSPLRRLATPQAIAQAALFLASDAAAAISGVLLPVDAGDMPGA